jgi:hypothetical protein
MSSNHPVILAAAQSGSNPNLWMAGFSPQPATSPYVGFFTLVPAAGTFPTTQPNVSGTTFDSNGTGYPTTGILTSPATTGSANVQMTITPPDGSNNFGPNLALEIQLAYLPGDV